MEWVEIDQGHLPEYDTSVGLYWTEGVTVKLVFGKRRFTDGQGEHYIVVLPDGSTEKRTDAHYYLELTNPV